MHLKAGHLTSLSLNTHIPGQGYQLRFGPELSLGPIPACRGRGCSALPTGVPCCPVQGSPTGVMGKGGGAPKSQGWGQTTGADGPLFPWRGSRSSSRSVSALASRLGARLWAPLFSSPTLLRQQPLPNTGPYQAGCRPDTSWFEVHLQKDWFLAPGLEGVMARLGEGPGTGTC